MSTMIQFVSSSMKEERLIVLIDFHQLDAEHVASEISRHLSDAGYNAHNIVSRCCDGASVMGWRTSTAPKEAC